MKLPAPNIILAGLAAILLLTLAGCQAQNVSSFFVGNQVSADDSLPLVRGKERSGQWQTYDLLVNYRYRLENDSLTLSGNATLSEYYQINMRTLRDMDLFLFFLDERRRVLETVLLFKSRSSDLELTRNFSGNLPVPAGSEAIGFGYRGYAREGRRAGFQRFDHLPKQSP